MSRKPDRQKKTGTRAASAAPTLARMSRAPNPTARVSQAPTAAHPTQSQVAPTRPVTSSLDTRTLPEPPSSMSGRMLAEPVIAAPTEPVPHHWSDPPARPQFTSPPVEPPSGEPTPVSPPTPTFTVPKPQPVAAAPTSVPAPAAARTPPHGTETAARSSDPGHRDHPDFADHAQFFASLPPRQSLSDAHWEDRDELKHVMAHGSKRAMLTTFWILGVSAILIGAFIVYNQVIMPAPVQLTGSSALNIPMPIAPSIVPAVEPPPPPPTVVAAPEAAAVVAPEPVEVVEPEPKAAVEPVPVPVVEPPPSSAPVAAGGYQELLDQANLLSRQGKRQRALETYELAIAADPNGHEALSKVAYHYLNVGKNNEAREYAQRAVSANPRSSEGWIVLGAAREGLRDREGAKEAYRQCATIAEGSFVTECKRLAR